MSVDTQASSAATAEGGRARHPGWTPLVIVLTGVFMTTLDFFIVNVAIPSAGSDLHASPAAIQFVVAGFGLAVAAGLITAGRFGDLYGRRRVFAVGMAVFTLASAACGIAQNTGELIGARVVQGIGAALIMPQALGVINTVYTGRRRAVAFNAYGLALGLGAVFGQLIGGALIQADIAGSGWRSIFLINVPVGLAALAAVRRVPESRAERGARVDLLGTALVALGLVAVVLPLVEGRQQGWPLWTWLCLAAAVPLLGGFVAQQRALLARGGEPLLHPEIFRARGFTLGLVTMFVLFLAMASFFLILALYLQEGRGMSALGSGLLFLALGGGYFAGSALAPKVAARLRRGGAVLALGAAVMTVGYLAIAETVSRLGAGGGVGWMIVPLAVAGLGMGLVLVPLTPAALAEVLPEHAAAASGALSTMNQVGGAVGIAGVGIVFFDAVPGGGVPHAFTVSVLPLAGVAALVALLRLVRH